MSTMNTLININFEQIKRVGVRVDFNVPIDENFHITDNTRLLRAKETLNFLKTQNAKILILSHFGRPKDTYEEKFSFNNLIKQFSDILEIPLQLLSYEEFLKNGLKTFDETNERFILLDNIRFFEGEKKNDLSFSQLITNHLDLYVNEAFSASHRNHASVSQMAKNLLSTPGINFEREIIAINDIKKSSKKKLAIIGGSKVSTKINTLLSLTQSCVAIFIGGAMANNFLKYNLIEVGASLIEEGSELMIKDIYDSAKKNNCQIHLPIDVCLDDETIIDVDSLAKTNKGDFKILDLADSSNELLSHLIDSSEIVLWNGPMGMIEDPRFAIGSTRLAHHLANCKAEVVVGGGDTLLAINISGEKFENYHFVSTAGGAFLEALENKELPGVLALTSN